MIVVRLHHPPKMLWYLQASIGRRCHRKRRQTEYHMTDIHGIWLSITCQKSPWDPFRCEIHLPSAALDTILRNNELILEKICKHRHQVVECPPMKTYENPSTPSDPVSAHPLPPHNVISGERFFNVIPVCLTLRHNLRVSQLDKQNHPQKCRAEPMVPMKYL